MFGSLGVPELIFIFALALLIFGPRKLPEIGRTIGRGLSEFRKASTDLKRSINAEMIEEEIRQSDPRKVLREPSGGTSPEPAAGGEAPEAADEGSGAAADAASTSDAEAEAGGAAPAGSVPRSAGGSAAVAAADPESP